MSILRQEGHQLLHHALVNTESLRHAVQVVKHLEQQRTRLVDRADHRPSLLRETLHQGDALAA